MDKFQMDKFQMDKFAQMKPIDKMTKEELIEFAHVLGKRLAEESLLQEVWLKQLTTIRDCAFMKERDKVYPVLEGLWLDCQKKRVPEVFAQLQAVIEELSKR